MTANETSENSTIETIGIQTKRQEIAPVNTIEARQINGAGMII